jgi:hypothetical protein
MLITVQACDGDEEEVGFCSQDKARAGLRAEARALGRDSVERVHLVVSGKVDGDDERQSTSADGISRWESDVPAACILS